MQEPHSQQGSRRDPASSSKNWFLESPNRVIVGSEPGQVIVIADGIEVAVLEGHHNSGDFFSKEKNFRAAVYDFKELNWTHRGALLQMQGELVSNILGPALCFMRGRHRVPGHPRPGADDVRILVPLHNPEGLRAMEMFRLASIHGF